MGLTALAGSLVAVSAQAGELSVSGSANMTYKTNSGIYMGTGIGSDKSSAWSMSGSGELDNGWTIAHDNLALTDAFKPFRLTNTKLTMGSMGSITSGAKDIWFSSC